MSARHAVLLKCKHLTSTFGRKKTKKQKKTHAKQTGLETVVVMLHVLFLGRRETMEVLRVTERLGPSCFRLAIKTRYKSC